LAVKDVKRCIRVVRRKVDFKTSSKETKNA